ncbi:MAG: hypothetical protein A3C30_03220 [Candidatus Levybacteria bacterium RIFCSPHIGHO2_02_FULL_40_18]|nr:MAG: hypothetical protein A2869_02060 [Candidatus Levybacteria bacterium RIFCSPHIGHO2_01_FULL_40_58]OGH26101.1 MAG: hypothetical protein A3C30_03220 [Candidatus Levybacteria bacterium RIFCSPHIGHO2_02_FULL_40_18]OGH32082.1 MAG: hypothetical protein A3E43_04080 [Candidatus Levybacteria bacterium RIFCSPHIGHO2_12_FULL_40_31]OGH39922.1 MAG: hypothetical protein A2894_02525 [Candidatus Levybacteria bacterium RIFCSPLOWO2_01_FULL_40_64]OGH49576.1 MAG: hypothetical protein A3I54_05005 [Candidatus Lev
MAQNNSVDQLIKQMEDWFSKLPALPNNWRDVIVTITPWLALIFGIIGVLGSLAAVGILTFLAPFMILGGGVGVASGGIIGALLALVASVLLVMAFPGTRDRKMSGWRLLFFSEVVSIISSVVAFSAGGVVGALVGFYILFQIKSHYK